MDRKRKRLSNLHYIQQTKHALHIYKHGGSTQFQCVDTVLIHKYVYRMTKEWRRGGGGGGVLGTSDNLKTEPDYFFLWILYRECMD